MPQPETRKPQNSLQDALLCSVRKHGLDAERADATSAGPFATQRVGALSYDRAMSSREFTVRATREVDWRDMRELRLEMLRDTPIAYGETVEHALGLSESEWRMRARRGENYGQTAMVAIANGRWVGIMGGHIPDPATGPLLVGVYVAPNFRGSRSTVSDGLLDAIEAWASEFGSTLRLEVHERNGRARAFYEKRGYALTGRSQIYALDPSTGVEYEMLKRLR